MCIALKEYVVRYTPPADSLPVEGAGGGSQDYSRGFVEGKNPLPLPGTETGFVGFSVHRCYLGCKRIPKTM